MFPGIDVSARLEMILQSALVSLQPFSGGFHEVVPSYLQFGINFRSFAYSIKKRTSATVTFEVQTL